MIFVEKSLLTFLGTLKVLYSQVGHMHKFRSFASQKGNPKWHKLVFSTSPICCDLYEWIYTFKNSRSLAFKSTLIHWSIINLKLVSWWMSQAKNKAKLDLEFEPIVEWYFFHFFFRLLEIWGLGLHWIFQNSMFKKSFEHHQFY